MQKETKASLVKVNCVCVLGFDWFSNKTENSLLPFCSVISHNDIVLITRYALLHAKEYC